MVTMRPSSPSVCYKRKYPLQNGASQIQTMRLHLAQSTSKKRVMEASRQQFKLSTANTNKRQAVEDRAFPRQSPQLHIHFHDSFKRAQMH